MKYTDILTIDFDKKRNYGLDILRALAILFVLNGHSAHFLNPDSTLFKVLTVLNPDGVTLFFVLSGFLIGGILIKMFEKGDVTFKTMFNFWKRRWFRTLPNYFLTLTILIILGLHYKTVPGFDEVKRYYYFMANFKSAMPDYLFPEAWSLSIEEWFYLLVPAFIFIMVVVYHFKPKFSVLIVALSVILFSTWFRYYRLSCWPAITEDLMDAHFRKQVITRLDSIMYGVIGAYLAHYYLSAWKKYKKSLFFIGIALLYVHYTQYLFGYFGKTYAFVFSCGVQTIGFLFLFPLVTELKSGKGFIYNSLTRISILSYSMYLLNYSIIKNYMMDFLDKKVFNHVTLFDLSWVHYSTFWFLTIFCSVLLYKYFEKPFTNLRDIA